MWRSYFRRMITIFHVARAHGPKPSDSMGLMVDGIHNVGSLDQESEVFIVTVTSEVRD